MRHTTFCAAVFVALCAATLLTACTSHSSSSPTAPSAAVLPPVAAPAPVAAGATITGTVSTGISAAGRLRTLAVPTMTVAVRGTSVSAPVGADGAFTLVGVPAIDVVLTFSGPGIDATLTLGAVATDDKVQVTITVSGNTATLESQQRTGSDSTVKLEGAIASVSGSCPSLTVTVRDARVQTTSATTFPRKACADIKSGDAVSLVGMQSGGVVTATTFDVALPPPPTPTPTPTPEPTPVTLTGTISNLSGSCPQWTFTVGSTRVQTNSATTFPVKACGDVKSGDAVTVTGKQTSDGALIASSVTDTTPVVADVTMSGTVSSVSGSCPSLTFTVSSTRVFTNSSTTFAGKGCGDLKNGDTLGVGGVKEPDGSVRATYVSNSTTTPTPAPTPTPTPTPSPTPSPSVFTGTISGLTGTCPSLSMTVGTTKVLTNSATIFGGKTCSALKNGDTAGVAWTTKQDSGTVIAYYISVNPQ